MLIAAEVRALQRNLLRAGSFATWPSAKDKKIVWSKIRDGFQENRNESDSDKLKVLETNASNTIIFLLAAGRFRGIERQIINNLTSLHYFRTQYERQPPFYNKKLRPEVAELHKHAYDELDLTVAMLNESLDISLR